MNKKDTHAFVNQLLVYTLVMICFSGSIGLGTVWLRHQISLTANNTKRLEQRIIEAERHLAELNTQITAEQSIDVLARRNNEWKLGLVLPKEPQVVRVSESPERRLASRNHAEVFAPDAVTAGTIAPVRFRVVNSYR
jgi:N-acetylmuramic acid 6-phosphate (MurNAc-6-P) etherase